MTEQTKKDKKYVFVMVHADLWGAMNANKLVKAVVARNTPEAEFEYEPILFVSRSKPTTEEGVTTDAVEKLEKARRRDEADLWDYFEQIDTTNIGEEEPLFSTFNGLAKHFCADKKVHQVGRGKKAGGGDVTRIMKELAEQGIEPEIILSGDTLAVLENETVLKYPCFGTHPGPLPQIPGLHGSERSLINGVFFDKDFNRIPASKVHDVAGKYIQGTVFKLAPKLDDGPILAKVQLPYIPGVCLLESRARLYDGMTDTMVGMLDQLLDPAEREKLTNKAMVEKIMFSAGQPKGHEPNLTGDRLDQWETAPNMDARRKTLLSRAVPIDCLTGTPLNDYNKNRIIDPYYLRYTMDKFMTTTKHDVLPNWLIQDMEDDMLGVYSRNLDQSSVKI